MAEKRLIDANALADRFRIERESSTPNDQYEIGFWNGLTMAQGMALSAPTVDAVEVVRCKDCKTYSNGTCWKMRGKMKPEDFCSYGERRTYVQVTH